MNISNTIKSIFELANGKVEFSSEYAGWEPDLNSRILQIARQTYKSLFKKQPVIKVIHAGLECGIIYEKYPDIDMISIGPTILGAHSPDECIDIQSVKKYWTVLLQLLKNIPENKK